MKKTLKYVFAALAATALVANANMIQPTSVSSSGTYSDWLRTPDNLINGTGLSGAPVDDGLTAGGVTHTYNTLDNSWVSQTPNGSSVDFYTPDPGTVQLDFDLGGAHDITTAYIWGYFHYGDANSATAINVSYSTDGTTFGSTESIALAMPPAWTITPVQAVNLPNAVAGTTHVRFLITDNGFGIGSGGDRIGLNEVQFGTIPEPATLSLVAVFGGAVLFMRRKMMI